MSTRAPITVAEFRDALRVYAGSEHVNPMGPSGSCVYSVDRVNLSPSPSGATHCLVGQVLVNLGLDAPEPYAGPAGVVISELNRLGDVFDADDLQTIITLVNRAQGIADGDVGPGKPREPRTWGHVIETLGRFGLL